MFKIEKEIFESYPNLIVGVLVLKNIDNSQEVKEVGDLLNKVQTDLQEGERSSISEFPSIVAWQEVHKKFGNNPKRYAPSVQALIKRVIKGGSLPRINTLVDIYNYISLKYVLPVGGEDIDKTVGEITLGYASGKEKFKEIGSVEENPPEEGEVVYKDDYGVICRKFNWREADRTKLTKETKNAVIVIESVLPSGKDDLSVALEEMKAVVLKNCGGQISSFVLDENKRSI